MRGPATPAARRRGPTIDRGWAWIFGLALVMRLGLALWLTPPEPGAGTEEARLDAIASNLAHGRGYSTASSAPFTRTAAVSPLSPWISSLAYNASGTPYRAAVVVQGALSALVPVGVVWLATACWGGGVGQIAGVIAALDPVTLLAVPRLSSDAIYALCLVLALAATASWVKTPRRGRALGTGVLWGIGLLAHASAIALPAFVAAWAWAPLGLTVSPSERLRQIALVFAGIALVVAPWSLRNAAVTRDLIPIASGAGVELLAGNNGRVWDDADRRGGRIDPRALEPSASGSREATEAEADRVAARIAASFAAKRVAEWPAQAAAKLAYAARRTPALGVRGDGSEPLRPLDPRGVCAVLLGVAALWGCWRTGSSPRRWFLLLPFVAILYDVSITMLYSGAAASRLAIEPLVGIVAAAGIDDLRRRFQARARGFHVIEGIPPLRSPDDASGGSRS